MGNTDSRSCDSCSPRTDPDSHPHPDDPYRPEIRHVPDIPDPTDEEMKTIELHKEKRRETKKLFSGTEIEYIADHPTQYYENIGQTNDLTGACEVVLDSDDD